MKCSATVPLCRNKPGQYEKHEKYVEIAKTSNASVLIIGDSIAEGLGRFPKVWNKYFAPLNSLNFGLGGDRTQNVLWRVENGEIPLNVQTLVVHAGTNNLNHDLPEDIANGVGSIAKMFQKVKPNINIILTGILPRGLETSMYRNKIDEINYYLELM